MRHVLLPQVCLALRHRPLKLSFAAKTTSPPLGWPAPPRSRAPPSALVQKERPRRRRADKSGFADCDSFFVCSPLRTLFRRAFALPGQHCGKVVRTVSDRRVHHVAIYRGGQMQITGAFVPDSACGISFAFAATGLSTVSSGARSCREISPARHSP